jgi:hypothetical protein
LLPNGPQQGGSNVNIKFFKLVASVFLSGCTVAQLTNYSPTAEVVGVEKPSDCNFKIQSTLPSESGFREIGVINGCAGTTSIVDYKTGITEMVCKAGGELVVGQVNGFGVYCLGIVFVKKPKP